MIAPIEPGLPAREGWRAQPVEAVVGIGLVVISALLTWMIIREVGKNLRMG